MRIFPDLSPHLIFPLPGIKCRSTVNLLAVALELQQSALDDCRSWPLKNPKLRPTSASLPSVSLSPPLPLSYNPCPLHLSAHRPCPPYPTTPVPPALASKMGDDMNVDGEDEHFSKALDVY